MQTKETESRQGRVPLGWRRLGLVAAAAMALWSVALQAVAGTVIPPVLVVGTVFAGLAGVLWRSRRRWTNLVVAIVPLAALAANVPPIVFDLTHPEEAVVFFLTTLSVVGALATSLAGFMLWFRRPSDGAAAIATVAVGIVVVAAAVGAVARAGSQSVPAAAGDVAVTTQAVAFEPAQIAVDTGGGIWVDNADPFAHTFSVRSTDVDLHVPGTSSRRIDIELAPGTYEVFCAVPGHESMTATLVVEG